MIKKVVKKILLEKRGISIDRVSTINFNIEYHSGNMRSKIRDSKLHITSMGEGCSFENTVAYGDIRLGRFVSFSGPGIILHAEDGKIEIRNFVSIGQNVSIQQFNHNIKRATTYAMQKVFFGKEFKEDCNSKGDIVIEDDVWIGSNATICSGVHIGRGAIIGAGAVVVHDVAPYTINGGVPSRILKMRFSEEQIKYLEESRWWTWDIEVIQKNNNFFKDEVGMKRNCK